MMIFRVIFHGLLFNEVFLITDTSAYVWNPLPSLRLCLGHLSFDAIAFSSDRKWCPTCYCLCLLSDMHVHPHAVSGRSAYPQTNQRPNFLVKFMWVSRHNEPFCFLCFRKTLVFGKNYHNFHLFPKFFLWNIMYSILGTMASSDASGLSYTWCLTNLLKWKMNE